jgi:hypothetical protein
MSRFLKPSAQPESRPSSASASVYEHRDPAAFAGDLDEPEAGWRRIGEINPETGAWVDGPPRWVEQRRPWSPWGVGR